MKSAFMFPIYLALTNFKERRIGSKSEKKGGHMEGPTRNQRGRASSW